MSGDERERELERLVTDLWREYQCENDCRICVFYMINDEDPMNDECSIETRMKEVGLL